MTLAHDLAKLFPHLPNPQQLYLFEKLQKLGWIERVNDKWLLTKLGEEQGGQIRNSAKFGDYIVWDENLSFESSQQNNGAKLLNATAIGKHFNISSQRINLILSEFGWIEKDIAGWKITKLGKQIGGKQYENDSSGGTYVLWAETILNNKDLTSIFKYSIVRSIKIDPNSVYKKK